MVFNGLTHLFNELNLLPILYEYYNTSRLYIAGDTHIEFYDSELTNKIKNEDEIIYLMKYVDGLLYTVDFTDRVKIWNEKECIKTLKGHEKDISQIIVVNGHPCTTSNDKTVKIWDSATGLCLRTLEGHTDCVNDIIEINSLLYTASDDKTIKIWNFEGTLLNTLEGHTDWVLVLLIMGNKLCSSSRDSTVRIWVDNHCATILEGSEKGINEMIKIDNKRICTADNNNTIKIWNIDTELLIQTFQGYCGKYTSHIININSKLCSIDYDNKSIKIWDLDTGVLVNIITNGNEYFLLSNFNNSLCFCNHTEHFSQIQVLNLYDFQVTTISEGYNLCIA